jgi:gluconate 2-dehydrogenase gamma chain
LKRRAFLQSGTALAAAPAVAAAKAAVTPAVVRGETLDAGQWALFALVQEHLLPGEPDAPGAADVNATTYLDRALADPGFDPDIRGFLLRGAGWLDEHVAETESDRRFVDLNAARREDLLRSFGETRRGGNWLSTLIDYTLEALLADPIYGGNPDGIGWAWLEHDPGRPRPDARTMYRGRERPSGES